MRYAHAFRGGVVAVFLSAIAACALWSSGFSAPLLAFAYVSPGQPTGFVNDFAKVLTAEQVFELNKELAAYSLQGEQNEISVVTIPSLGGDDIESYTSTLFAEWGIGKQGKDNGVLLLIAVQDRKMRIEVGYGAEPLLTDAQSGRIIRNTLTPAFQAGDFYGGISKAVREIATALSGEAGGSGVLADDSEGAPRISFDSIVAFAFLFFGFLGSVLGASKSWWLGGVIGGIGGVVIGFIYGFLYTGLAWTTVLVLLGLLIDFLLSRSYHRSMHMHGVAPWWFGGGKGGSGGGFGGFGGGHSGGGGASGNW